MIIKELDPFHSTDKFRIAGRKAEEQMAFYLKRYFVESEEIYVINDLRLGKDGESLQIDHLVVHQNGLIIVESKSVSGKLTITNDMQWIRDYKENRTGMQSPIIQVEIQKMLLTSIIEELNSKFQARFPAMDIDFLISISDNGIIDWPDQGPIYKVHKAENICNQIKLMTKKPGYKYYKKLSTEDAEKLKQDILSRKIKEPSETEFFDSNWQARGNYPQLISEFFYLCHLVHIELHNEISEEKKRIQSGQFSDTSIHCDNEEISEISIYEYLWNTKFKEKNLEFYLCRLKVRRQEILENSLPIKRKLVKKP